MATFLYLYLYGGLFIGFIGDVSCLCALFCSAVADGSLVVIGCILDMVLRTVF